ncbi:MAG: phosphodiester glycosidase family protein [Atopobiaceae bacterium]
MSRRTFIAGAAGVFGTTALTSLTLMEAFLIPRADKSATAQDTSRLITSSNTSLTGQMSSSADATSTEAASITATSYISDHIQISIEEARAHDTTYYVADIQISSPEQLKCALAQGTYGKNIKETTSAMAEESGAILAINGDYYGWRTTGYVIRNGILYRTTPADTDVLVVGADGSLYAASDADTTAQELLDEGAWQVLSFGPVLVSDSQVAVSTSQEVSQSKSSNPRTSIGMVEPLHYNVVVSDGRTDESAGLSLYQLAQIHQELGSTFAYNLDGGGSSTLWFNGNIINNPTDGNSSGERSVSDIVYFA